MYEGPANEESASVSISVCKGYLPLYLVKFRDCLNICAPDENLFFRIGTIILALHDTSDVFLETAKLFKYSEKEIGASMFFGLFAVSWLILRLIFFPFWIIKSSSYESVKSLRMLEPFPTALYYVFNTMLLTLLVFHMYWWKLTCAMIMRQMSNKGKVGEDIRSDSEDD